MVSVLWNAFFYSSKKRLHGLIRSGGCLDIFPCDRMNSSQCCDEDISEGRTQCIHWISGYTSHKLMRDGEDMMSVTEEMSSWRIIFLGCVSPRCLDRASEALFLAPGMCTILNLYLSVLSLRFLILELDIC